MNFFIKFVMYLVYCGITGAIVGWCLLTNFLLSLVFLMFMVIGHFVWLRSFKNDSK